MTAFRYPVQNFEKTKNCQTWIWLSFFGYTFPTQIGSWLSDSSNKPSKTFKISNWTQKLVSHDYLFSSSPEYQSPPEHRKNNGIFQSGKRCGDEQDLINGRPTGAVRVSFGRMSSLEDVRALELMIDYCFLASRCPPVAVHPLKITAYRPILSKLFCYPVKSCRGFELSL